MSYTEFLRGKWNRENPE
jgi:8-oxo-dGTP pyrophosphatase MutT (NUDIX family)